MVPKVSVKFRKRKGVPYAIEMLSGKQFRCRHCNEVFLREDELDSHIRKILRSGDKSVFAISSTAPVLSASTDVHVIYSYDLKDKMKKKWLKLKEDEYDGI